MTPEQAAASVDDDHDRQGATADHRLPPNDLEAERVVLAHVVEHGALDGCEALDDSAWFSDEHRLIWQAAKSVLAKGLALDYAALGAELRERGTFDRIGGARYLVQMAEETPATVRVKDHVARVVSSHRARSLLAETMAAEVLLRQGTAPDLAVANLAKCLSERPRVDEPVRWLDAAAIAEPLPAVDWTIAGLGLAPGRPNLIFGRTGSVKTIMAQHMALSVAARMRVLGQFSVGPGGKVCHLDYDQGLRATRRRYQKIARAIGVDLPSLGDALRMLSPPPIDLTSPRAEAWLVRELSGARLLLLDSLIAACPGEDENDPRMAAFMHLLWRVSEATGCCVLVIHHSGKSSPGEHRDARDKARGHSSIIGAAGCAIEMSGSQGEPRLVSCVKPSVEGDGEAFESFYVQPHLCEVDGDPMAGLALDYLTEQQVDEPTSPKQVLVERTAELLRVVEENPGATLRTLRALAKGSRAIFDAALEALETGGKVRVTRTDGRGGAITVWPVASPTEQESYHDW